MALITDLDGVLASTGRRGGEARALALTWTPRQQGPDSTQYIFRFDGSFQGRAGAGIGITLGIVDTVGLIASFSLPTQTLDA